MIKNYLKTGIRNLRRYKFFTAINIVGFSVGLATCFIIFLFIDHETSFDRHLSKADQLYRIVVKEINPQGTRYHESVPYPLAEAIREELLDPGQVVSTYYDSKQIQVSDQLFLEQGLVYTDSVFCRLFDVDFLQGHPTALDEPGNVLLTNQLVGKYFGNSDPIGKKITIGREINLTVQGIIENPPQSTHLPYKMLISAESLSDGHIQFDYDKWGSNISRIASYVHLNHGVKKENIEKEINDIYHRHRDEGITQKNEFFLLPVKDLHTDGRFDDYPGSYVTSKKLIWIFISIGFIVLAIALINFINLSLVQAIRRSKEVGLRKVVGATRKKLVFQFLGETFIIVSISVILAFIITEMLLPLVNTYTGNRLHLSLYGNPDIFFFIIILTAAVSFLGGAFPALFLSAYRPIDAIRKKVLIKRGKTLPIQRVLVVLQFFIAQVLVIFVITIHQQVDYLKNKDLGFNKENLIVASLPHASTQKQEIFRNQLRELPDVSEVSLAMGEPLSTSNNVSNYQLYGEDEDHFANMKAVDAGYLSTYGIRLKYGRGFRPSQAETDIT
ncbi:MAG TPA: ABC transporter permease, partial [Bacteroidales bacterium]|nr:ABC transporter permease [Bacteroidales bacterium]